MRVEILIALVCSAVTAVGIVYLGAQFFETSPAPSQPQARGIVWGGRTFVDLAQFSRWLRSQGVAYEVWALRHPTRAGIARLQPQPVPQEQRAQPSATGHSSTWTTVAGIAVVLASLSLLIGIRRRGWLPRLRSELTREQFAAAARGAGAAAAAGVRPILRLAIATARTWSSWTRSATRVVWRRRGELAWYVAGALFATMSALALTAWG